MFSFESVFLLLLYLLHAPRSLPAAPSDQPPPEAQHALLQPPQQILRVLTAPPCSSSASSSCSADRPQPCRNPRSLAPQPGRSQCLDLRRVLWQPLEEPQHGRLGRPAPPAHPRDVDEDGGGESNRCWCTGGGAPGPAAAAALSAAAANAAVSGSTWNPRRAA